MSATGLRWSKVVGSGSYLPPRVVTNQELSQELAEKGIETSDDWIVERTGIRQRHLVEPGVKTSFLAIQAAQAALEQAGINAADVDLIVLATSTPDRVFPSTACMVQAALGCEQAAAFDVQAVCSGFVYAMATADSMIRTGQAQCALVIGADVFSRIIDWNDRGTCVLFGDGAGALVLKASDEPGIIANDLGADGRYDEILCTQGSVAYGELVGDPFLRMDGQSVFKLAVNVLGKSAKKVVAKADIELSQVDWLVPHQANVRILQAIAKKLAMPLEKVVITVDQHANTSAATVPLAYDVAVRDGRIQSGQLVMLQGVGGGFTWGSVLIRV